MNYMEETVELVPNRINKVIGEVICEYRERRGMSQSELAQKFGISQLHLCNLEQGKRNIDAYFLMDIADFLDFSTAEIQERLKSPARRYYEAEQENQRYRKLCLDVEQCLENLLDHFYEYYNGETPQ